MSVEVNVKLLDKVVQYGGDPNDLDKIVKDIVSAIPSSTRGSYPEDESEAALAYADTYFTAKNAQSAPVNATQTPQVAEAQPVRSLTGAQLAITKQLQSERYKPGWSQKTSISKLLVEKPASSSYIKDGTQVVPICSDEKRRKYEANLVDEDRKAFEEVMAAVANSKPLPVYTNDNVNVVGYRVNTPSGESGQETNVEKPFNKHKLMGYIMTVLGGEPIMSQGPFNLGCELRHIKPKSVKVSAAVSEPQAVPRLFVTGRKEALANKSGYEIISKPRNNEFVTGNLSVAQSFKIKTDRQKPDGTPIIRTVRIRGKYDKMPVWERTNEEYAKLFPVKGKFGALTGKYDKAATLQSVAYLIASGKAGTFGLDEFVQKIDEADAASAVAAPAVVL
jgi:hypothetical protein